MRTFVLAISSVLLLSMNADAALTGIQKCRSYVAKVEMDYAKCLKKGVVLQEKGKSSDVSKCDRKRDIGILKAEALYVAKQGVDSDACGLDETSLSISKALMLVAAGEDPADYGISAEALAGTALDATSDNAAVAEATCVAAGGTWVNEACKAPNGCDDDGDGITICEEAGGTCENGACTAVDITSDNASLCTDAGGTYDVGTDTCSVDLTSDNEAVCTGAGGTWDGSVCTPAAVAAGLDCFRAGLCGADGHNIYPEWWGQDAVTSGCSTDEDSSPGILYAKGVDFFNLNLRGSIFNDTGTISYNLKSILCD